MVWAGLRGAVGLALALLVAQTGGDQRAGKQMLFMVAGLAFLTLIVNGTTSGPLLEWWGMLGVPEVFIIFL
jgi:NhaP-type Na+/H+ or K+/H+ antiporter